MSEVTIDDLDAAELAALDHAQLHQLDDPLADIPTVSRAMAGIVGAPPRLQIDITVPPSPVIAEVAGVQATGSSADATVRELGTAVSDALAERAAELGVELPTPPPAPED